MREYFTADLHFGHPNIIVYTGRPFLKDSDLREPYISGQPKWTSREIALECAEKMAKRLIAEINMRCKKDDVLNHIGDFCCYGRARGVEGSRVQAVEYEKLKRAFRNIL